MAARTEEDRQDMEDALRVGGTRPATKGGLPILLVVVLFTLGYLIWVNVTGLRGLIWAVAVVGPTWLFARLCVANDLYGIDVLVGWFRTSFIDLAVDRTWHGASTRSPLPMRTQAGFRGIRHVG